MDDSDPTTQKNLETFKNSILNEYPTMATNRERDPNEPEYHNQVRSGQSYLGNLPVILREDDPPIILSDHDSPPRTKRRHRKVIIKTMPQIVYGNPISGPSGYEHVYPNAPVIYANSISGPSGYKHVYPNAPVIYANPISGYEHIYPNAPVTYSNPSLAPPMIVQQGMPYFVPPPGPLYY